VVVRSVPKARLGLNAHLTHTRQRMQTWPHQSIVKTPTMLKNQRVVKGRANDTNSAEEKKN